MCVKQTTTRNRRPAIYVLEGFDPSQILDPSRKRCGDRSRFLLHTIHTQTIFNQRNRRDGVHLKFDYLKIFLGKPHCRGIIEDLERGGVIEVDRIAHDGRCNRYRISAEYRTQIFRRYFADDEYLNRAITKWRDKQTRELTCETRIHLKNQLPRVRIDFEEGRKLLEELRLTETSFADCLNCLTRLKDQEWYFVQDDYGRVHHNLTCIKRELRKIVTVDGKRLVELDIPNSQPLFLGLTYFVCNKHGKSFARLNSDEVFSKIAKFQKESTEQPPKNKKLVSVYKYLQNRYSRSEVRDDDALECEVRDDDAWEYLKHVEQGTFYRYFADLVGEDISQEEDRTRFKQKVFSHVFFAKKNHMGNKLAKAFKAEWPSIYEFIMDAKGKDQSRLAGWMQKVESNFVIDRVVAEFAKQRPKAFIATVHDSILVNPDDSELVMNISLSEFGKLGIKPKLSVK